MIDKEAKFYAIYIKKMRKKEGLSLKKFGELFGVSGQTILDVESGKTKKPSKKIISRLSNYMKVEDSKIYNELYFGDRNYKYSLLHVDGFVTAMLHPFFLKKGVVVSKTTEEDFRESVKFLYKYVYGLNKDWLIRYDTGQLDYMGRALHYSDRRNIVYIITWDYAQIKYDFHIEDRASNLEIENIFLHSMFEIMKSKKGKPRTFTILFDAKEESQINVYNYLSSLEFKAPKFFIQFVLYDVKNKIKKEKMYK